MKRVLFFFLMFGFLVGCGFHLRGVEHFPPPLQSMFIETKYPNTPVVLNLRDKLMDNGVVLTSSPAQALTILELSQLSISDQAISLLGAGQASIHQLTDSLTYTLRDAKTRKVLLGPITLYKSRNYSTNASLILSDDYVSNQISHALQKEIASGIFAGLSRVDSNVLRDSSHETSTS